MKRVVIDARESGTSTGRYIDKLVEYLHKLKPAYDMVVITKPKRVDFIKQIAPSFTVVSTPYKEFTFGEQLGFKKQIESLKPDLVHFGMVQQPVLYRGKVVTTMHDLTTARFSNPSKNWLIFKVKQFIYKLVNERVARKSLVVLTPTEFVKQDVAQFAHIDPSKIVVTYEAADKITEPAEAIGELVGKQFIMYVGRPTPHKNLGRLIDAFVELKKTHPDLVLALAGKKDALYEQHEQRVKAEGIKDVVFTGFVTDGNLRWMYEHCVAYVFPSLSEGFGLPGVEAMIHGAPVASSNLTCLPEVYGRAAVYFDPLNVQSIAETVAKIIDDTSMSNKLRTRGREQAHLYSWNKMAEYTFSVYQQVLSEK